MHTEPDFWQKIKHKLSIPSSQNLRYLLMNIFEFNKIDFEAHSLN